MMRIPSVEALLAVSATSTALPVLLHIVARLRGPRGPAVACSVWILTAIAMLLMPFAASVLPPIDIGTSIPILIVETGMPGASLLLAEPTDWTTDASQLLVGLYLLVLFGMLARIALGVVAGAVIVTSSERLRPDLPTQVRFSRHVAAPLTIGALRPVILLPRPALRWSEEKIAASVAHEMSHLRRRDTITLLIASVNRAVHWYHPIAWLALRKVQHHSEILADQCGATAIGDGTAYARHLVDVAREVSGRRSILVSAGASMARRGHLTRRIEHLLQNEPRAGRIDERVRLAPLVIVSLLAVLLSATMRAESGPGNAAAGAAEWSVAERDEARTAIQNLVRDVPRSLLRAARSPARSGSSP